MVDHTACVDVSVDVSVIVLCRYQTLYDFLRALLNDLSYLMDDSFDRIADVQSIAAAQADSSQWAALAASEKATKERFKQSQACPLSVLRSRLQRSTCSGRGDPARMQAGTQASPQALRGFRAVVIVYQILDGRLQINHSMGNSRTNAQEMLPPEASQPAPPARTCTTACTCTTARTARLHHQHAPQLPHRHRHQLCPQTKPHHDIITGTANPASTRMPCSREVTSRAVVNCSHASSLLPLLTLSCDPGRRVL